MCGIAGILTYNPGNSDRVLTILKAMSRSLRHRGPDAEGIWAEGALALAHHRLSIQDLSDAGAQPMHSENGRHVIIFNGEIYNHLNMRHELEADNAAPVWRGHSDTETLLAGITHWGLDKTLQRAKGMFAIALWDRSENRLSLARDRMGEKPLYWGWAGRTLVFGSELKALKQHPDCPSEVCRTALAQYLTYGYVPAPHSIHPGVYKLEPGSILEVDGSPQPTPPQQPLRPGDRYGSIQIRRYWSLNETLEAAQKSQIEADAEALEIVEAALYNSIKRQMISDVPLGAFLSGGIDSSLIISLMQRQSSVPVNTFTVGFENADFDEAPYAANVAKHLGTAHTEITVTERDARDVIPFLPDLYDEPFADASQIPTYLVCGAARKRITVALSGDAGDELFGGYNRHFLGPKMWSRLESIPKPIRAGLSHIVSATPSPVWDWLGNKAIGKLAVSHAGDKVQKMARALREVDNIDDLYRSLISSWQGATLVRNSTDSNSLVLDDSLPDCLVSDPAGRMMFQDMRSYLPDDILCKVDRAAMGVSLETRVPFLDPDVIIASARLPTHMKIRNGQGKWPLRQILYRHVPRELLERPKTGFSIPIGDWLRGPLRSWADDLLSPEALGVDDLIDPAPIIAAWKDHLSGRRDYTQKLWIILMFQAWREHWS